MSSRTAMFIAMLAFFGAGWWVCAGIALVAIFCVSGDERRKAVDE